MTLPAPREQAAEAAILAFPARAPDRLRHALRSLDIALAEQREAVAGLRRDMGALAGATSGLGNSLGDLGTALDRTAGETARAGAEARRLEKLAAYWDTAGSADPLLPVPVAPLVA